jgi:hypothetical protein
MKKKLIKVLKPDLMERFFALVMAMTLVIGGLLYWRGYIKEPGLILLGVFVLVAGVSFTLGIRTAQIHGFLDGYVQAKDDLGNKKED